MNEFLGTEVLIMPILWAILGLTVVTMIATSFKRVKIEVEDEDTGELILEKTDWTKNTKRLRRAGILGAVGALVLASIVQVPPGHRGAVYTTSGISSVERPEGYSFLIPVVNSAVMVNVREQKYETVDTEGKPSLFAQTKDVLEVPFKIAVNYRVSPDKAADIFRDVGQNYEEEIIWPAVLGVATGEIGKIDAADIPNKRFELATAILGGLADRLAPVGISVTSVQIQDSQFPGAFTAAVLAKEVAEERQEETRRLVNVAKNEADAAINLATGQAEALAVVAQAEREQQSLLGLSPTEYVWYKVWNGALPSTLLSDAGSFIIDLPATIAPTPTPGD